MKKLIIATIVLALAAAGTQTAKAGGDCGWSTAGKILTGVAIGTAIASAVNCDAHPSVTVTYSRPVYCPPPAPVVYAPAPVCAPAPVVVYRPAVVLPPPVPVVVYRTSYPHPRHHWGWRGGR